MKKKLIVLFALLLMLASCGGGKTVTKKEDVKKMVEDFYKDLYTADPVTMSSYFDGELSSVFTRDKDKMHVDQTTAGYDYYLFMEDGKKYLIADDRTVFEDDSMYDMSADTIRMVMAMNVTGYLEVEDENVSFEATNKDDKELTTIVKTKDAQNNDYTVTTVGKKGEDGKISEISSEIKSGEQVNKMEYRFTYGEGIELPEYKMPVKYDNMPHVDSPYSTFGEVINQYDEENVPMYCFYEDQLVMIDTHDGRHYQYGASIDQEIIDAYENIDFMADDSQQQVIRLISDIEIDDCIDFTDAVISQDALDSYIDKTIQTLIDDGFEVSGYVFNEDSYYLYVNKDLLGYKAEVTPEEGFDFDADHEYEDFNNFTVKHIEFEAPEYEALPMK